MKFILIKPASLAKHLVPISVSQSQPFGNTGVSWGPLTGTAPVSGDKSRSGQRRKLNHSTIVTEAPGHPPGSFWSWNSPVECSQLGLGGMACGPTFDLPSDTWCSHEGAVALVKAASNSYRQLLVMNPAVSSWKNKHLGPGSKQVHCSTSPPCTSGSPSVESPFVIRMWPRESPLGLESIQGIVY